jgi:hypothetical protein
MAACASEGLPFRSTRTGSRIEQEAGPAACSPVGSVRRPPLVRVRCPKSFCTCLVVRCRPCSTLCHWPRSELTSYGYDSGYAWLKLPARALRLLVIVALDFSVPNRWIFDCGKRLSVGRFHGCLTLNSWVSTLPSLLASPLEHGGLISQDPAQHCKFNALRTGGETPLSLADLKMANGYKDGTDSLISWRQYILGRN